MASTTWFLGRNRLFFRDNYQGLNNIESENGQVDNSGRQKLRQTTMDLLLYGIAALHQAQLGETLVLGGPRLTFIIHCSLAFFYRNYFNHFIDRVRE